MNKTNIANINSEPINQPQSQAILKSNYANIMELENCLTSHLDKF
jgi:hypothetical protein